MAKNKELKGIKMFEYKFNEEAKKRGLEIDKKALKEYLDLLKKIIHEDRKELLDRLHHILFLCKNYVGYDTQLVLVAVRDIQKAIHDERTRML